MTAGLSVDEYHKRMSTQGRVPSIAIRIAMFLFLGAAVNVVVAWYWGFASEWSPSQASGASPGISALDDGFLQARVISRLGAQDVWMTHQSSRLLATEPDALEILPNWLPNSEDELLIREDQDGQVRQGRAFQDCHAWVFPTGETLVSGPGYAGRGWPFIAGFWKIETPGLGAPARFEVTKFHLLVFSGGFAANTAFYALIFALLHYAPRLFRRLVRARRGACPACGYDLRGAAHERCPECGGGVASGLPGNAPPPGVVKS